MEGATFSTREKSSCRIKCCVKDCGSTVAKNLDVIFHKFPKPKQRVVDVKNIFNNFEKVDHLKAWQIAVKIHCVKPSMRVCSRHFKREGYVLPDVASQKIILKKTAVLSCNLKKKCTRTEANAVRSKARLKRREKRSQSDILQKDIQNEGESIDKNLNITLSEEILYETIAVEEATPLVNIASSEKILYENIAVEEATPLVKDCGVQVNTLFENTKFISFLKTDSDLSSFTGIEYFDILNTDIVKLVSNDKFEKNCSQMNTKDRIIMTYIKLKLNMTYKCLSVLFSCCTAKHCQRIFYETINILSSCLSTVIDWPSKKEISRNLPKCFEGFENVRMVLDCTEIFIQRPANLCCQVLSYSHYKGSETLKFMTGVTPAGNICYVSRVYGGRASDSSIFQQSDLVNLLEPGDAVMVDKGFLIEEICEKNGWKCIRPPFLREKAQFSKPQSILSSKIAAARVHVERSNQRIKMFKILGSKMPANILPIAEDIFTVICGTVNICAPILKDKKFMNS